MHMKHNTFATDDSRGIDVYLFTGSLFLDLYIGMTLASFNTSGTSQVSKNMFINIANRNDLLYDIFFHNTEVILLRPELYFCFSESIHIIHSWGSVNTINTFIGLHILVVTDRRMEYVTCICISNIGKELTKFSSYRFRSSNIYSSNFKWNCKWAFFICSSDQGIDNTGSLSYIMVIFMK